MTLQAILGIPVIHADPLDLRSGVSLYKTASGNPVEVAFKMYAWFSKDEIIRIKPDKTKFDQTLDISVSVSYKTTYEILLENLEEDSDLEQIRSLAREVLIDFNGIITPELAGFLENLRTILYKSQDDDTRAIIIQLLAELGDRSSSQVFIDELIKRSHSEYRIEPTLSFITAVTYVRYLDLEGHMRKKLINVIIDSVSSYRDVEFQNKKQLIMGSIITLGSLGKLDEICDSLLSLLNYKDLDIREEVLDTLNEVWVKAEKEKEGKIIIQYRDKISSALLSLINAYDLSDDDSKSITPSKRIMSLAFNLLAKVDSEKYAESAHKLLLMALAKNSSYLLASFNQSLNSVLESIKTLTTEEQRKSLNSLQYIFRFTSP